MDSTMETKKRMKYQRAQQRVAKIRRFYNHLAVYLAANIVLILMKDKMTFILLGKRVFGSPEVLENMNWDVFGTPIIWGIFLIFHAVKVFGNFSLFGPRWEEKKIQQFLGEDESIRKWN